jgi:NAD(P)-dependent dehydrogenase (short-subunit alcohol dehydrogenase family)
MRFDEQVALVTGGASGIGRAIAETFAARGARVCIADLDLAGAEGVAAAIGAAGGDAFAVGTDVAHAASVDAAVAAVEGRWGALHALVNCAGIDAPTPLAALDEATYDRVVAVDQKSVYLTARRAADLLARSGGAIVNIASVMAWYTAPNYVAYTAAKAAVVGMTRALAVELGPTGVRVNAVCPGFIDTPIWQRNLDAMDPDAARAFAERIAKLHPLGRRGRPDDVADATAFLCSAYARFITGTTLVVDGGVSLRLVSP